jgi:hypothetical protein
MNIDYYNQCRNSAKLHTTEQLANLIGMAKQATLIGEDLDMLEAMQDEYAYRTWNNQENYDRLHESAKMGGSFNAAIIEAFFKADNNNKPRLVEAFPEIFMP